MEHASRKTKHMTGKSWSSVAFIVESIVLLFFLAALLALLTKVFTASLTRSIDGRTLDAATIAASTVAEHFAADPEGVEAREELGDLLVLCDVDAEVRTGGTMYTAHIQVYDTGESGSGELVYSLDTSRYESGVR